MQKKCIAIIIVTYNSEKYIFKSIEAIKKALNREYLYELIIIDNHSQDNTKKVIEKIQKENLWMTIIRNEENFGFAKAVNRGLKIGHKADYFLLINPDTVIEKNAIKNLVNCLIESKSGIVGGITYDINNQISGNCFRFPNLWVGIFDFTNLRKLSRSDYWHRYFYYIDNNNTKKKYIPVDVVTGGFMMITKETILNTGYFDERFFMYLEDVDYCLRAKKKGITISHCNLSSTLHYGGGSSGNEDRVCHGAWMISRKQYYIKNFSILSNMIIQPLFLLDDLVILFKMLFK